MSLRIFTSLSGRELAGLRREAGLNQTEFARAAGIGRNTVSYWENKAAVRWSNFGPRRMLAVLGITVRPVIPRSSEEERLLGRFRKKTTAAARSREGDETTSRPNNKGAKPPKPAKCGALTRMGRPCPLPPEPGKGRCRAHGGLSTGIRTEEGRVRIAEAQRRRWAEWRAARTSGSTSG